MSEHSSQSPINKNMSRGEYAESTSYSRGGSSKRKLNFDCAKGCSGKRTSKEERPNSNKVSCFGKVHADIPYAKLKEDKSSKKDKGKKKKAGATNNSFDLE